MNKKFEEKTLSSKGIYKGRIINVKIDEVQLPNGKTSTRELVEHPGAVGIIPITADNKLIVVEQYRKPLERSIVEIPAGKLEPGELPEVTAVRELEEETGFGANRFTYLQTIATSPGFANEVIHLYIAQDLYDIEEPASLDEDEFVELMAITLEEAEEMIADGRIFDAKTVIAVMWMRQNLK
ncbi:NUDIX domain-containing protein [Kurthia sibirica]|uniref:ADP-ribose pyrophosphatase n=1 Tax=Kurthia sibirica TaxID=202750 RepID=A0A2U3ARC3_9BACL|nr:NUDIX hydrolase [Kurthia sibirica]PWI27005.1 ADP-ribose pyrophosphatase [Kurthia sibirica]GEK34451.1 ADP-ribose pyrophosphatase [Kurthia sibirica]